MPGRCSARVRCVPDRRTTQVNAAVAPGAGRVGQRPPRAQRHAAVEYLGLRLIKRVILLQVQCRHVVGQGKCQDRARWRPVTEPVRPRGSSARPRRGRRSGRRDRRRRALPLEEEHRPVRLDRPTRITAARPSSDRRGPSRRPCTCSRHPSIPADPLARSSGAALAAACSRRPSESIHRPPRRSDAARNSPIRQRPRSARTRSTPGTSRTPVCFDQAEDAGPPRSAWIRHRARIIAIPRCRRQSRSTPWPGGRRVSCPK